MTDSAQKSRPHLIPSAVVAALLFIATAKLPYGYYTFLRFAVCGVGVYVAYVGYVGKRPWAAWTFAAIAVVFNPLIPVHLTKQIWAWLDVAAGVAFILAIFLVKKE